MPKYLTAIFGSCPTCYAQFGHAFDQEAVLPGGADPTTLAREVLAEKVRNCHHDGVGAKLL